MDEFLAKLSTEFSPPFHNKVLFFSVILLIILLSPILLRRLKIPGIIGLILSGIAVGPNGFNLLENNDAVKLFSTIGLLYIMFIAGLELDLKEFSKNKYKSLVFGVFTFVFPFSMGFPVCHYLLGYDFSASLLIASMFSTHTLVAYPIVSRMGIVRNPAVAIAVGGTIFTDTAVLILLAVITAYSSGGGLTPEFWLRLGISISLFMAIVIFVVPRFAAWFFKKLEGEKNSHFIFVLSMVFFCAFMAELAGLEPIIGAFAAGLALNKLIPHTSTLMNRVEFVGNSLFIPFFLISVGMIIDFRVLLNGPFALIVAGTLTAVAIFSKWFSAWLAAWVIGYTKNQRNLIFGLSNSHAAATLAIIMVGFRLGIIGEEVLNGTIILILITCMVASFVTENAAKKVVLESKETAIDTKANTEQKILVPLSSQETMERLLDLAIIIKKSKSLFPVICLTVIDDNEQAQKKLAEAKQMLEKGINHLASADQNAEMITTLDQNVPSGIKRVSKEILATEIIIGVSQKSNWADFLFGKTNQNIVEQSQQMVLTANLLIPLNVHNKILVVCPPYAEKEYGFAQWIDCVVRMAGQLSLRTLFFCNTDTLVAIKNFINNNRYTAKAEHKEFTDWEDFLIIGKEMENNPLLVVVLPRKGGVSYNSGQNNVAQKIDKHFKENSYIIIHPEVKEDSANNFTNEFDGTLIEKGVTQIAEGAKAITKIFKKETDG